jgi:hypothetical protein
MRAEILLSRDTYWYIMKHLSDRISLSGIELIKHHKKERVHRMFNIKFKAIMDSNPNKTNSGSLTVLTRGEQWYHWVIARTRNIRISDTFYWENSESKRFAICNIYPIPMATCSLLSNNSNLTNLLIFINILQLFLKWKLYKISTFKMSGLHGAVSWFLFWSNEKKKDR